MNAPKGDRLYTTEDIAAAGRAAVGDRQPTEAENERIAAILAPVRDVVLAQHADAEPSRAA